ncbi:hypothetical protein GETHOR_09920 [Geothrix oryzae]|uniref:Uncharacterized protein n=1 Tax=Geothrix oryzae TaxID=2927975 RepID=A0ABN6UVV2_9BACT|nr:hypothetical protein [Geothrix oryzae]BDU68891.1 hypothetical protein GETHOR_09920 [Geothrix oryzae]
MSFWLILIIGVVVFFVLRGKKDRAEQLGASRRALPTAPLEPHVFPCPYPKCPTCGATGDKMKQDWDGLRAVKWTCGYCGAQAGVQTLKDEELPPSARRRLGLDAPMQGSVPMQQGGYGQPGGGMGGLLTGMMIGSMMGGGHQHHDHQDGGDGWGGGSSDSSSSDWGESGSSDGGDSGGDWGGGDSGGDSGGDW